jgi:WD40 repeat protein
MSDPVVHWGDAPAAVPLLGREHDVGILNAATERIARLVAITGAGGLGKSTLARVWAESVLERFEAVVWYGFKNRPPLTDAYHEIRQLLAPNDIIPVADTPQAHGNEIVSLLNGRRVLLILDNLETIMQSGAGAGPFEPEYQHLETLLNRVAERTGDGLVLLTSRELPDVIAQLAGRTARTVICGLQGLGLPAVRPYLAGSGLQGSDEDISSFAMHHDGNPYAMRLAADYIRFNYPSDGLHGYVRDGLPLPGRVAELLQTQAARLSDLEQLCLLRLAAERAPLPASVLVDELSFRWSATDVRKALEALNVRSLLEPPVQGGLNLQNLLVEFATDLLIRDLPGAVMQASIDAIPMPLACLPLIHPSAPQHVRNAQMNALAIPVAKAFVRLSGGRRPAEEHLLGLLSSFQNASTELLGFAPGTMVNLLLLLGTDLSGRDLSMLPLWHCDFENSDLQDASLCDSDLRGSSFSDILGVVTDVCFDAKGNHLFVATADGLLRGWDAISWQHVVVHAHDGYVRAISYDAAENRLISVGDDRRARIWSADGLEHRYDLDNADRELKAVAIAPGGQVAAIGGQDGLLHLQPLHGGAPKTPLHGHSATVRSVRFLDTESLVSADEDGLVLKWKVGESRSTARYQLSGPAWSVAVAADTIAVGGQRGGIVLLDRDLRERLPHIEPAGAPVWAMAFVEGQLCIATSAGTILCHRLSDGRRVRTIQEHSNWVRALAAHPRLPVAASGSEDQTVRVFIPDSGLQLRTLRGSARSFWTVAYSADGAMLAAAGSGRSVYVWNNDSSTPKRLRGYPTWIRALRFSPSSPLLAVAGDSGDIHLWDLAGQEPRGPRQLGRHTGPIWSLDFDSAGEWLASAGEDRTVRVWPLSDEAPPGKVVHSHSSWVVSVRYSPDGRALASGAYDGRLLVTTPDGSSPSGSSLN